VQIRVKLYAEGHGQDKPTSIMQAISRRDIYTNMIIIAKPFQKAPSYDDFTVSHPAARHPLSPDGEIKLRLTSCDLLSDLRYSPNVAYNWFLNVS
jgi:hypothetical protein